MGSKRGQLMLGLAYTLGKGIPVDYMEAEKWLKLAAAQDNSKALYMLGDFRAKGINAQQDDVEAVKFYREAAELGLAEAQYKLGEWYEAGRGVEQSDVNEFSWYRSAVLKGDEKARKAIDALYAAGRAAQSGKDIFDEIAAQRQKAQTMRTIKQVLGFWPVLLVAGVMLLTVGFHFLQKARFKHRLKKEFEELKTEAEAGNDTRMLILGLTYVNGVSGMAEDWIRHLIEKQGGKYICAAITGEGVPGYDLEHGKWSILLRVVAGFLADFDEEKALTLFRSAAKKGNFMAQYLLGTLYEEGKFVAKDEYEAFNWYFEAAQGGSVFAMRCLGDMYAEGRGTTQNDAKAFEYFQLGAEAQHPAALLGLGKLYAEGRGVTRDDAKAREYYEYAANRGNWQALYYLGLFCYEGRGGAQDYRLAYQWFSCTENGEEFLEMCAAHMTESEMEAARNFSWEPALTHEKLAQAMMEGASAVHGQEQGQERGREGDR
jgi:TPR repeat protein